MVIHLLKSVDGGKLFTAKCSERTELKKPGPLPDEYTAWASKVTCQECVRKDQP